MQVQVATFVYDPLKPPTVYANVILDSYTAYTCVFATISVHTSYICDAVGAHDICFFCETFGLRLFGARDPCA